MSPLERARAPLDSAYSVLRPSHLEPCAAPVRCAVPVPCAVRRAVRGSRAMRRSRASRRSRPAPRVVGIGGLCVGQSTPGRRS